MVECGYVDEEIIDFIFEREDMLLMCFGNFVVILYLFVL